MIEPRGWIFKGRTYLDDPRTRRWTAEEFESIKAQMECDGQNPAAICAVIYNRKLYRPIPADQIVWC